MNNFVHYFGWALSIVVAVLPLSITSAQSQPIQNLSFLADIFGNSTPENIEYMGDLRFYSWGGFGINAHVYRAFLQGGDQIAYAVSANTPNAFTLNVTALNSSTPVELSITTSEYSAGVVNMPSSNKLDFVWHIQESGFDLELHKRAELIADPNITAGYYVSEVFTIENLGAYFDLNFFSEYLHMDDISRLRDFNGDGTQDTLLAINNFSTSGYPVFGKVYVRRQSTDVGFVNDGKYATISHYPLYKAFPTGVEQEVVRAAYVTGLAKNSTAEQQVAADARLLLAARPCELPFFSQVDREWSKHLLGGSCDPDCIDSTLGYATIEKCGCTLTSAAMVFNTYGATKNPADLSDCMARGACPFRFGYGASNCSDGTVRWEDRYRVSWNDEDPTESWNRLDDEINQQHRPVILGMHNKQTGVPHWVVVYSGSGSDPSNYRIHDPALVCGANNLLSTRYDDYDFDYMATYEGNVPCNSVVALIPPCVGRGANPQPVIFGGTQEFSSDTSPSSAISGAVWIHTMTEITMTVELTATSDVGSISEILVWSDTMPNSHWQSFAPFVWLPVSDVVFVRFRDDLGTVSDTYSGSIHPAAGPPLAPLRFYLPIIWHS